MKSIVFGLDNSKCTIGSRLNPCRTQEDAVGCRFSFSSHFNCQQIQKSEIESNTSDRCQKFLIDLYVLDTVGFKNQIDEVVDCVVVDSEKK